MVADDEFTIFDNDPPDQAAEFLRLTLALLNRNRISANPLNYDLFYTYVAGKNQLLNNKIDKLLANETDWDHQEAIRLFNRFFTHCGESLSDDLRDELLQEVAQIIGSLVDIAGKTRLSNKQLKVHIDHLANSKTPADVLKAAAAIISETRAFVTESQRLEAHLLDASEEMNNLKAELINARREATTDSLTGLHNRRGFDLRLQAMISDRRKNRAPFSLIIADLDHFKDINDTHGHLIGDKVLISLGRALRNQLRSDDYLARFGGEEFVTILPHTSLENAVVVAEKMRLAIDKLVLKNSSTGKKLGNITISLGIATYRDGENAEVFVNRCDEALYKAKKGGRNKCVPAH
ncbi:MAG: GGDEF domain-containing protein [Chromatiales bacterium]|jgi:diguanylate cyclase